MNTAGNVLMAMAGWLLLRLKVDHEGKLIATALRVAEMEI
jgi:hypothetical protein